MIKLYHDTSSNYEKLHIFRVLYDEKLDLFDNPVGSRTSLQKTWIF
jgi:hypothetical protein